MQEVSRVWRPGISKVQVQMRRIDRHGNVHGRVFPLLRDTPTPEQIRYWMTETSAYPTPPGSGNVYARNFLEQLFPSTTVAGTPPTPPASPRPLPRRCRDRAEAARALPGPREQSKQPPGRPAAVHPPDPTGPSAPSLRVRALRAARRRRRREAHRPTEARTPSAADARGGVPPVPGAPSDSRGRSRTDAAGRDRRPPRARPRVGPASTRRDVLVPRHPHGAAVARSAPHRPPLRVTRRRGRDAH